MPNQLTDMSQLGSGFHYAFPNVAQEAREDLWFDGQFSTLLKTPTLDNGLKLFENADLIGVNLFKFISNFVRDATLSQPPQAATENEAYQAWHEENFGRLFHALRDLCDWWSRRDMSVLVAYETGQIDVVNPTSYFRVGHRYDPDDRVGHKIAQVYVNPTPDVLRNPAIEHPPDRIRVISYAPNFEPPINLIEEFEYSGSYDQGFIGRRLSSAPAGISYICILGEGRGWYKDAAPLIGAYMTQLSVARSALNHYEGAPRAVPDSLFAGDFTPLGIQSGMTPTERGAALRKEARPWIPVPEESGGNISYLVQDPGFEWHDGLLNTLGFQMMLAAGVSPQAMGFDLGANESGIARERAQYAVSARAESWQRDLLMCLPHIVTAMGAPESDVRFSFTATPFEDRLAAEEQQITRFEKGIMTRDEVRQFLGLPKLTDEDMMREGERARAMMGQGAQEGQEEENG